MVGRTARCLRHRACEAECAQIELIDEHFDETNRVVRGDLVVEAVGKERDLLMILACDEPLYPDLPRSEFTLPDQHVFTQPGPMPVIGPRQDVCR